MFYKKVVSMAAALAFFGMLATTSAAQAQDNASGFVKHVYFEPHSFVVLLSNPGRCGTGYFYISRTEPNFKEVVAGVLTAIATNRQVIMTVTGCLPAPHANRNRTNYVSMPGN